MAGLDRGHERKKHGSADADRDTKNEDAPINLSRQINNDSRRGRGERKHERVAAPIGNGNSANRSDERQEKTLSEELFDKTASTRAESEAHCDLVPAHERASEQQIA